MKSVPSLTALTMPIVTLSAACAPAARNGAAASTAAASEEHRNRRIGIPFGLFMQAADGRRPVRSSPSLVGLGEARTHVPVMREIGPVGQTAPVLPAALQRESGAAAGVGCGLALGHRLDVAVTELVGLDEHV